MPKPVGLALLVSLATFTGCADDFGLGPAVAYEKPTVAVLKFDNRAGAAVQGWNLGDGASDILVERLMATGRFHVVERAEIAAIQREVKLQNSGATRQESRAATGRLRNVQYLIKGAVTDFGHVSSGSGFGGGSALNLFGGSARAVMGLTLHVVEVESGEIISSQTIEESVRADDLNVAADYKGVSFGGNSFYKTPLGKATAKALDRAVRHVVQTIANRPWQPKIALLQPGGAILLSGGADRNLAVGTEYDVVQPGPPILSPDTGDPIGHAPDQILARLRITEVNPRSSQAELLTGNPDSLQVGLPCRRAAADGK